MATLPNDARPLAERVYELISTEIINGQITAGSALVQEQIGSHYGVSRTPVRDALTRLTHEGLATLIPGQGYIVNNLTDQDVEQVYEVRRVLETLAARQACGMHTPLQLLRLRTLVDESELIDAEDAAELFRLSRQFHAGLVEPCRNSYLLGILDSIWAHPIQLRITMTYQQGREHQAKVVADHRRILHALTAVDVDAFAQALTACHDATDLRTGGAS